MSAWNARTEAAREDAASADSEEKDVKIPVEDANEAKVQDADVEGADTVEPSEEEMVAAAIAAGEQAANDDFKLKYEAARDELAELRNQVALKHIPFPQSGIVTKAVHHFCHYICQTRLVHCQTQDVVCVFSDERQVVPGLFGWRAVFPKCIVQHMMEPVLY